MIEQGQRNSRHRAHFWNNLRGGLAGSAGALLAWPSSAAFELVETANKCRDVHAVYCYILCCGGWRLNEYRMFWNNPSLEFQWGDFFTLPTDPSCSGFLHFSWIQAKKKIQAWKTLRLCIFLSNYGLSSAELSFACVTCTLWWNKDSGTPERSCPCLVAVQPGPSGRPTVDRWHLPHQAPREKHLQKRVVTGGNLAVIFLFLPLIGWGVRWMRDHLRRWMRSRPR